MRPVNKLPGNALAVQAFYTPPSNFTITGLAQAAAIAKWGNNTPTVAQALLELQRINRIAKANRTPNEVRLKKALDKKVGDQYPTAADGLMFLLGNYCSYCESVISQTAEVEHVLPKSIISTNAVDWDNFLLSCNPCNNAKGNKPSLVTMQALLGLGTLPTNPQYENGLETYFIWPDKDEKTYKWITYSLGRIVGAAVNALSPDQQKSVEHRNANYDRLQRSVVADIYNATTAVYTNNLRLRVTLTGTGGTGTNQANNAAAAGRSIDLMQLNTLRGDREAYDSRVNRRTDTWLKASQAIKRLRALRPPATPQAQYDDLWDQVMDTATATGFFSTWLTVFYFYPKTITFGVSPRLSYNGKFLSLLNIHRFPNTNQTKLPTN